MSENPFIFSNRRRASSFGDDAEQYDRVRPPYPAELIDRLMADQPHDVLDVGCGTGIVSRLFSARGCAVVGLDPDPRMAEVARRRGTAVEEGAIEEWDPRGRTFDLAVAGQSWHWVEPHVGARRAAAVLRPGGRIGLFWNQAHHEEVVRLAMDAAYAEQAPELGEHSVVMGQRSPELYEAIAAALRSSGLYQSISIETFWHAITYSADQWVDLLGTHSDHRTLEPGQSAALLAAVHAAVIASGGVVPVHYETTLVTGATRRD
jgi:SAM-dependent methyltransferase